MTLPRPACWFPNGTTFVLPGNQVALLFGLCGCSSNFKSIGRYRKFQKLLPGHYQTPHPRQNWGFPIRPYWSSWSLPQVRRSFCISYQVKVTEGLASFPPRCIYNPTRDLRIYHRLGYGTRKCDGEDGHDQGENHARYTSCLRGQDGWRKLLEGTKLFIFAFWDSWT